MPTYNYAHFLDEAITSVLNQTFSNFELIIVDDKSSDNTDKVVEKYLADPRIRYYKNLTNLGLVGNFNKCLEYSKGKYIKYLLADDKLHPQLLEKFIPIMESNEGVSLITSNNATFGQKNRTRVLPFQGLQKGNTVIYHCLKNGNGNHIGEPTVVMFRKSSLEIGNFSTKYPCLVDLNMWLRLLLVGDCYIVPETLSYFRSHAKQASTKTNVLNWVDEYNFYKDVKLYNPYRLEPNQLSTLHLDSILKDRATHCAKGMFRILHKVNHKKNRIAIAKAFRIAYKEGVLITGLLKLIQKRTRLSFVKSNPQNSTTISS
jgi:glycosyltransferase involved in cell wall biosynthesis